MFTIFSLYGGVPFVVIFFGSKKAHHIKNWKPERHRNLSIFGHTDLRIGVSRAKFGAESDFEVRLAVAPQKLGQNSEKLNFPTQKIFNFFLSASKN